MVRLTMILVLALATPLAGQVDGHVIFSLMASRSTEEDPGEEYGNIELKIPWALDVFTLMSIDIAMSEPDSVGNTELTTAGTQLVRGFPSLAPDSARVPYVGAWVQLIQGEPLAGPVIGGVELDGSVLHGSRISMGLLFDLQDSEIFANRNLVTEFVFRCDCGGEDLVGKLLQLLHFRGQVVVPFNKTSDPLGTISIMVPLAGAIGLKPGDG